MQISGHRVGLFPAVGAQPTPGANEKSRPEAAFDRRGAPRRADSGLGVGLLGGAVAFFVSAFATLAAGAAAPAKLWPLTVSPSADSLAAAFSFTPLTRLMRSGQSLNAPCLRASTMRLERAGPTPRSASSSASVALLTSTAAQEAVATSMATMAKIFFSILRFPDVVVEGMRGIPLHATCAQRGFNGGFQAAVDCFSAKSELIRFAQSSSTRRGG